MTTQIQNSKAYGKLEPFQQGLVIRRVNRKQIEDAVITARTIGYNIWEASSPMSSGWKAIVKELSASVAE
jgi:hypothetical protein